MCPFSSLLDTCMNHRIVVPGIVFYARFRGAPFRKMTVDRQLGGRFYKAAIIEISTRAFLGRTDTCTVSRAGKLPVK